ncbi:MAG TPA: N-acetylmuramoyl-L-alanine amidase [Atopostipes sp.]|nr:N-acetylmuramoyl-L-alanine amidase [Atopostipes sp.]
MSSNSISQKIEKLLPNKIAFITFFMFLILLTAGAAVALANENMVTVETAVLNVRYGPGLSHEVLTQVEEDDRLFLLGEENKWYKVRLGNDQVGWVASWLVDSGEITQGDSQYAKVTGEAVNIRQFSNTDSEILGTVYKDAELQILYQDGDWYQVLYMGQVAWIHGDYIEILNTTAAEEMPVNASAGSDVENTVVQMGDIVTNIRSQPTTESEVIYAAQPGEQFEFIENNEDWYHIRLDENTTGYVAGWVSSIIEPSAQTEESPAPTETASAQYARTVSSLAEATIVIDAGHGGYDPGAISPNQMITEKDITLDTALLLKNRLEDAGTNVILTRGSDQFISLDERVQTAHAHHADAFISLHYDAVEQANTMSGTTTYYYFDSDLELANTVNRYLAQNTPLTNNGVRLGNYYVLRTNRQPSILLELGYMNSDLDLQYIDTHSYQATIVEAVYQALREYYSQ